jgi:hypothetical protein
VGVGDAAPAGATAGTAGDDDAVGAGVAVGGVLAWLDRDAVEAAAGWADGVDEA